MSAFPVVVSPGTDLQNVLSWDPVGVCAQLPAGRAPADLWGRNLRSHRTRNLSSRVLHLVLGRAWAWDSSSQSWIWFESLCGPGAVINRLFGCGRLVLVAGRLQAGLFGPRTV